MQGVKRLISLHGVVGTVKLSLALIIGMILYFTPARKRTREALRDHDLEFDRRWGVDTSGKLVPDVIDVVGSNWIHGTRYQAVLSDLLEQTLNELALDFGRFTFIDLGSGKGRAVLIASKFHFEKVVGVEYSRTLDQVARHNLSVFPKEERNCDVVELVCADATQFQIPKSPLVLFINNPFGQKILSEVVKNIEASYRQEPRRIVVLYFNAFYAEPLKCSSIFNERKAARELSIYDSMFAQKTMKAAA